MKILFCIIVVLLGVQCSLMGAPLPPNLVAPLNGSINQTILPLFQWHRSATSTTYQMQFATDTGFTQLVVPDDTTLIDTFKLADSLKNSTVYYWRVRARDQHGWSEWSSIWSFTTSVLYSITASWSGPGNVTRSYLYTDANPFQVGLSYGDSTVLYMWVNTNTTIDSMFIDGVLTPWSTLEPGQQRVKFKNISNGRPIPYFFNSVTANHAIRVVFDYFKYTLNVTTGPYGTANPTGVLTYPLHSVVQISITPDPGYHVDSLIVDGTSIPPVTLYNVPFNTYAYGSIHTIRCVFALSQDTVQLQIADNWNIVSIPSITDDYTKQTLYPSAISDAYAYEGGYDPMPVLSRGVGYWLKFHGTQTVPITGYPCTSDTITLKQGWNLVGSITSPVSASDIISNTPGLVLSQFYGFSFGYNVVDSIRPGLGYWVKANLDGEIIFAAPGLYASKPRVRILPRNETPPVGPGKTISHMEIPKAFLLDQNFPNPFNPATTIRYQLPIESFVRLSIYNVLGLEVGNLINQREQPGYKSVRFDANNYPSGIYFYRISTETFSAMKRMVLIK